MAQQLRPERRSYGKYHHQHSISYLLVVLPRHQDGHAAPGDRCGWILFFRDAIVAVSALLLLQKRAQGTSSRERHVQRKHL